MTESLGRFADVPDSDRRRRRRTPRGRQVDAAALSEVRALLGDEPRRRDLLIEHLHLIQDAYGQISAAHLAALAEEMRLSQAEVFEVATFYAHFDVVKEGEPPIPPVTVRVCDSLTCAMHGSEDLLAELASRFGPQIRVVRAPCMGLCDGRRWRKWVTGPCRERRQRLVSAAVAAGEVHPRIPDYVGYEAYRQAGGYRLLERLRAGELTIESVLATLDESGLRGLGGAGFPAARKWRAVRGEKGPRLMAVNGDEGEPGTFKDKLFLETDPHRFLEGTLIAAHAIEAAEVYLYIRDEYPAALEILRREIAKLPPGGPLLHLRRGAGAYICGEESSLIESIEGKRGLPRHKPPYPFQVGLFGRPTLVNNVETLYWVRDILERGAAWWTGHGRNGRTGLRSLFGLGAREGPRREDRAGRHHAFANSSRSIAAAWPRGTCSAPICREAPRAESCPPPWATCRSISGRSRSTAASSARRPWWCSPSRTT